MGRKVIINDDVIKRFICNSYMNGVRIAEIQTILKRDFEVDVSDRTLYRFIVKNCESRFKITHRKNGRNETK